MGSSHVTIPSPSFWDLGHIAHAPGITIISHVVSSSLDHQTGGGLLTLTSYQYIILVLLKEGRYLIDSVTAIE